jgi:hypothetical protein
VQTQYSYRPNYITQQVAKTSYLPETQQVQVPVQVQRMQTEVVTQRVPVQVQRMETEMVTEKVPVQTTRMVPNTVVRKIPYSVQRPVTETLTRKVPVQQQKWVSEEVVRKVPVRTTRTVYETRREPIQVQYYEREPVVRKVLRPVTRKTYVPYTETVMVPRAVVQRTALSYYDPFSPAIRGGYSSFSVPSSVPGTTITELGSSIVQQPDSVEVMSPPKSASDADDDSSSQEEPKSRLKDVEFSSPENAPREDASTEAAGEDEMDPADLETLPVPETSSGTDVDPAGHRIRWAPMFAREV